MKQTQKLQIVSTISALVATLGLSAEELPARNQEPTYTQLPTTVVSAYSYEVPRMEVGSKVDLISREDLELGQSTFVIDALREVPAVVIRNNGGMGNAFGMTVRGLNGDRPIVLIDGIEVSSPTTGSMLNPGLLFTDTVEKVEFLKGAQSALYGADALAGAINVTTREPVPGERSGTLRAGAGSFGTRQASASFLMNEGKWDLSLGLNRYTSDGFSTLDGDNEDDGYENTTANLKLNYAVNEKLDLYLLGYYIDSEVEYDNSVADPSGLATSEYIFAKTGASLQATDMWKTELSFGFSRTDSLDVNNSWGETPFKGERYETQWRNVLELNDAWTLAGGAEYEHEEDLDTGAVRTNASYFLDSRYEVIENLFWSLGGRYDNTNDYGDKTTWRSTFSYLIEDLDARFHGSYGTSFTAPSLYNLSANPELKHQEGAGWDLGVEVTLVDEKLIVDVTAFGYDIDDKMTWDPTAPGAFPGWPGAMVNEGYESTGVESSIMWAILPELVFRGSYTYTDATSDVFDEPLYTPEHQANISLTWTTWDEKLDLKGSVLYIGERKAEYGSVEDYPDYATVNLGAQFAISERFSLWGAANNILDKDYEEIGGYNTAGFNLTVGVRLDF